MKTRSQRTAGRASGRRRAGGGMRHAAVTAKQQVAIDGPDILANKQIDPEPRLPTLARSLSSSTLGLTPRFRQSVTNRSSPPLKPTRMGLYSDTTHCCSSASLSSPTRASDCSSARLMFHSWERPCTRRLSTTHTCHQNKG